MFNLKEKFLKLFDKKIKFIFINNCLTITLLSKKQLVMNNITKSEYDTVSKYTTDEEVIDYYNNWILLTMNIVNENTTTSKIQETKNRELKDIKNKDENKKIMAQYEKLTSTGDFEEVDGQLFLKPIKLSIPKILIQKFLSIIDSVLLGDDEDKFEEYHALKNFWKWCSLCANPQSREDLFKYLEHQGLEVNKYGFFFAYRKVRRVHNGAYDKKGKGDLNYIKFISDSYLKIKTQKKAPKNFEVFNDNGYVLVDRQKQNHGYNNHNGNLLDLYNNLGSDSVQEELFTDEHTHSMDIRIGKEVSMPPEECDTNNRNECSSGLHIGAKAYGCGDTSILCIVNPMNSISVPVSDGYKMRVSSYFPIAILSNNHNFDLHKNANVLELGTEYFNGQLEKLNKLVLTNTPVELKQHKLMNTEVSKDEIDKLEFTIPDIKEILNNRVINS